jgi:uncharacterized protein (TIGR02145 family)
MKYILLVFALVLNFSAKTQEGEEEVVKVVVKKAENYFNDAITKTLSDDYKGAIEDFNKAIRLNPKYTEAYLNRGRAKVALMLYGDAIIDYNKAIQLTPKDADLFVARAQAKTNLKNYAGATEDYNKAIQLSPDYMVPYWGLAEVKESLGDYKAAILQYTKAIKLFPDEEALYHGRGNNKQKLKDYTGAINDYTKAIEINPEYANGYISRGLTKIMALNAAGGCEDFKKALELYDESAPDLIKEFCTSGTKTESPVSTTTPIKATEPDASTTSIISVKIGKQEWTTENLNVSTFRNGDPIPEAKTNEQWAQAGKDQKPAWCYLNNDPANGKKIGKLYNWYAVNDSRGLAPVGWHIPTREEWRELTDFLHSTDGYSGLRMKAKNGWKENGNGNNESGFAGVPGEVRSDNGVFEIPSATSMGKWWSTTKSNGFIAILILCHDRNSAYILSAGPEGGLYVRCIKD